MALALEHVLARPDVWRGDALASLSLPALASGYPALDAELPGGGWPRGQLTELLHADTGIGELALLLPALAALTKQGQQVVLILPPDRRWHVHAPTLLAAGLMLAHVLVVSAKDARDTLWAAVESLRCTAVAATVLWPDAGMRQPVPANSLRRLHVAADQGGGCAFALRAERYANLSSPAPLRLCLAAANDGLSVQLLKRRGRPLVSPLKLAIARPAYRRAVNTELPPALTAALTAVPTPDALARSYRQHAAYAPRTHA